MEHCVFLKLIFSYVYIFGNLELGSITLPQKHTEITEDIDYTK